MHAIYFDGVVAVPGTVETDDKDSGTTKRKPKGKK